MDMMTDVLGVRLNGPSTQNLWLSVHVVLSDRDGDAELIEIRGGVLNSRTAVEGEIADVSINATQDAFARFAGGTNTLDELIAEGNFSVSGDLEKLKILESNLDNFEFGFEIVLP
jgi:alkyl sulfatase BDS1-like metallo-beta-lactamase superfamily hydrolase